MAETIFKALEQVEFVMEAVTFAEFIYEEALQTAFFSLHNALRIKQYDLARSILTAIKTEIFPGFDWYVTHIGFLSPYSWTAFKAFREAAAKMIEQYEQLLEQ